MAIIITLSVIVAVLLIGILIYFLINKKKKVKSKKVETPVETDTFNLKIKKPYMKLNELKFIEILNRIIPTEFIAFPKVGVDIILKPKGDNSGFEKIKGKYVDVCVFLIKTMEPILAIDLYEDDTIKQGLKVLDGDIIKSLNSVKIPILKVVMKDNIDIDDLKTKILKSISNDILVDILRKK